MLGTFFLQLCVLNVYILKLCCPSLHSSFSHYETLKSHDITFRVKRDAGGKEKAVKVLTLSIFGRKVSLILKTGLPELMLSPEVKIEAIHGNGTKSRIYLDINDFHQGMIRGYPGSWVNAFHHHGLWTIQAIHPTMSFSVEPLGYYTGFHFNRGDMVAYRHEHIRFWNETSGTFCQHDLFHQSIPSFASMQHVLKNMISNDAKTKEGDSAPYKPITNKKADANFKQTNISGKNTGNSKRTRRKRNSNHKKVEKVCDILAIIESRFLRGVAGGSVYIASKIVLHVYKITNDIFSKTKFLSNTTVGVRIRAIEVHTSSRSSSNIQYLNNETSELDPVVLIKEMARVPYFKEYCLTHLHIQRTFANKTLGLAVTPDVKGYGHKFGMCRYGNFGLSSPQLKKKNIPLLSYSLVVTHEIAHNFGATHDIVGKVPKACTPYRGGTYLMWPSASSGSYPNNFKFSPCSIRAISNVLNDRPNCLVSQFAFERTVCGNGIVDYGEDCDPGFALEERDRCCTQRCRFHPHARCSPFNHPCCTQNCTLAPKTFRCRVKEDAHSCYEDSFCDGKRSHSCPGSKSRPNGHSCRNHGECWSGKCVDYCRLLGQKKTPPELHVPCKCLGDTKAMCSICCHRVDNVNNYDYNLCVNSNQYYDDGEPCHLGFCQKGRCYEADAFDRVNYSESNILTDSPQTKVKKDVTINIVLLAVLYFSIMGAILAMLGKHYRKK